MKLKALLVCITFAAFSCGTTKTTEPLTVADDYGYSETNPIKVGGGMDGPINERKYLQKLTGPNGEMTTFVRLGSCCAFDTKNSPFGGGMLDKYELTIEGTGEKKILYLNMYDKDKVYAPKGLLMKK